MPNLEFALMVLISLGPYFAVALGLALVIALFLPWGTLQPHKWFYFYLLFICLVTVGNSDAKDGSTIKQVSWLLMYALSVLGLYFAKSPQRQPKGPPLVHADGAYPTLTPPLQVPWSLLILTAYVFLSVTWSPNMEVSFKRSVQYGGMLLVALLSTRIAIRQGTLARAISPALALFLLIGVVYTVAQPKDAFSEEGLKAYTLHKNSWGQFCLLCAVTFASNILAGTRRWTYSVMLLITLVMLVLSKSATSTLATAVGLLFLALFYSLHHSSVVSKVALLLGSCVLAILGLAMTVQTGALPFETISEWVFTSMERSTTLTGRTQLWGLIWAEFMHHPWFGYGFGGFWIGKEGPSGYIAHMVDWGPPNQAHSGYLDILNELGIVGMALMAWVLLSHLYRSLRLVGHKDIHSSALHSAMLLSLLILNYAESATQLGTSLWLIVLMSSIVEVYTRTRMGKSPERYPSFANTHPADHPAHDLEHPRMGLAQATRTG